MRQGAGRALTRPPARSTCERRRPRAPFGSGYCGPGSAPTPVCFYKELWLTRNVLFDNSSTKIELRMCQLLQHSVAGDQAVPTAAATRRKPPSWTSTANRQRRTPQVTEHHDHVCTALRLAARAPPLPAGIGIGLYCIKAAYEYTQCRASMFSLSFAAIEQ